MSLIDARLDEITAGSGDVVASLKSLWLYDFAGYPVRVWNGFGRLFTADGQEWLGTMSAGGVDVHQTPRLSDGRDMTSRLLEFTLGYLDTETYKALRRDRHLAEGRTITHYECLFMDGEGLRPSTPPEFVAEFGITGLPRFEESQRFDGTTFVRARRIVVTAKDDHAGRSLAPQRTMTDIGQKAHALFHGVAVDKGCAWVAQLANRVIKTG